MLLTFWNIMIRATVMTTSAIIRAHSARGEAIELPLKRSHDEASRSQRHAFTEALS
jgi:hypothetical protein